MKQPVPDSRDFSEPQNNQGAFSAAPKTGLCVAMRSPAKNAPK
jgi:hypothetical protein